MVKIMVLPAEMHLAIFSKLRSKHEDPFTYPGRHPLMRDDLFTIFHTCRHFREVVRPMVLSTVDVSSRYEWDLMLKMYPQEANSDAALFLRHVCF